MMKNDMFHHFSPFFTSAFLQVFAYEESGQVVGELAVLFRAPRAATVKAELRKRFQLMVRKTHHMSFFGSTAIQHKICSYLFVQLVQLQICCCCCCCCCCCSTLDDCVCKNRRAPMRCCSAWTGAPSRPAVDDLKAPWPGDQLSRLGFAGHFSSKDTLVFCCKTPC